MTDPDAVLNRMNEYNCATCDATGTSHGIRPAGWGMETTEHAPSTWRRWCPPCWRRHMGLDKLDDPETCPHHGLDDVEATEAGDPERRYLRHCRGCGTHWTEFECGRCGKRNREPNSCPCRTFATGGIVKAPQGAQPPIITRGCDYVIDEAYLFTKDHPFSVAGRVYLDRWVKAGRTLNADEAREAEDAGIQVVEATGFEDDEPAFVPVTDIEDERT